MSQSSQRHKQAYTKDFRKCGVTKSCMRKGETDIEIYDITVYRGREAECERMHGCWTVQYGKAKSRIIGTFPERLMGLGQKEGC